MAYQTVYRWDDSDKQKKPPAADSRGAVGFIICVRTVGCPIGLKSRRFRLMRLRRSDAVALEIVNHALVVIARATLADNRNQDERKLNSAGETILAGREFPSKVRSADGVLCRH